MDPWSKADYSWHIREASMAMEGLPEVVPPSSRVRGKQRGAAKGSTREPGAPYPWATPPGRLGPWWVPSFPLLVIPKGSSALIFYIIFPEFLEHFKYRENLKYKNSRKQELALRCTELIG